MTELPAVLTVEETSKVLRLGRTATYSAIRAGDIPSVRLGHSIRVPRAALLALLGEQMLGTNDLPKGRSPADTGLRTNGAQAPERVVHDKPT